MVVKLNKLQDRTLALLQELAEQSDLALKDEETGDIRVHIQLHSHHDHMHIGRFTVSTRFASGLENENVWKVLERKGLIKSQFPMSLDLTKAGQDYQTSVRDQMLQDSDH